MVVSTRIPFAVVAVSGNEFPRQLCSSFFKTLSVIEGRRILSGGQSWDGLWAVLKSCKHRIRG